ncbi:hypothetical protein BS47DRAFT_42812 [Hydnum rufescens UP504]|uniref:Uncharacterized protein n=1 Tax=Hydnum rufescens UP504 TaxID=1448309 RepID=A0A9P6A9Y2_9AGAM|nr:hypothetical protein BS47DRAFT_42812 [Hydnum rufescens UP504]
MWLFNLFPISVCGFNGSVALTGSNSHDHSMQVFDIHYPLHPLISVNVGPNIEQKEDACMHDGFKVNELHDSVTVISLVEEELVDDKWSVIT